MQDTTATAADEAERPEAGAGRRRRRTAETHVRAVYPISAIWTSAQEEERQKARTLVNELLGYWLGHESKAALARRLAMPPTTVWQLSQRAMSGMLAAMLRPPTR